MRIGPIEINWSPRRFKRVWNRAPLGAKMLDYMTPTELRQELNILHYRMSVGESAYIPKNNPKQTIHFFYNGKA